MLLVFSLLAQNLVKLQVLRAGDKQLQGYYALDVAAPQGQQPPRGTIVDANGTPLVSTITVYKLAASPKYVIEKATTARLVTDILFPVRLPSGTRGHDHKVIAHARAAYRKHYEAILAQLEVPVGYVCLAGDDSYTCPAKFDITRSTADKITNLGLPGLSLEPRNQPSYPNGSLAAQVLGYVTYTYPNGQPVDTGQYGLQQYYDNILRSAPSQTSSAPQPGATLKLTLDSYVQLLVEQDLANVVHKFGAVGGTIIVERPSDGAIVAMASTPGYDPNHWQQIVNRYNQHSTQGKSSFSAFINPATSQQYEPGSTFKAFTVAIGLDTHHFTLETPVYDAGTLNLPADGVTIRNWCLDSCSFGGMETPERMLHYSSNIGAAQFGRMIPAGVWYEYLDRFGFGQLSGVDLSGEIPGSVLGSPKDRSGLIWVPAYKDTQAYGQGLAVTPLQLANAYSALANGGWLMQPHLAQSYTLDGKTTVIQPQRIRQVISGDTATQMQQLLVRQASGGEACKALVPGYDIAAKTGTASISVAGGYSPSQTIASTIAFNMTDDASKQFVVLVVVKKPYVQWGSLVAAPVVKDILQRLFEYYKVPAPTKPTQPLTICPYPAST